MTSDPPGIPELEELAAFIDGRLEGTARQAVIERLARDETYYEVYADTLRTLEEEEDEAPSTTVAPFAGGRRRLLRDLSILAAILAIAVFALFRPRPVLEQPGDFIAALGAEPAKLAGRLRDDVPAWSRVRSVAPPPGLPAAAGACRLGAHLIWLDAALAAGHGEQAQRLARRLGGLLRDLERPVLASAYDELAARLEAGEPAADVRPDAAFAAALVVEGFAGEPGLDLGMWGESCRLAATAGDADFFRRPRVRRTFDRLRGELQRPAVAEHLAAIDRLLRGGSTADELADLAAACDAAVAAGGNR